jgi:hypothetical protein
MRDIDKILKILDNAPDEFESRIPDIEKKIFKDVSLLLKDLKVTSSGNIESSVENLKLINEIKGKLGKIFVSKEYAKLVENFVGNIPVISNSITTTTGIGTDGKKMISEIARQQIDNTLDSLIGSGYKQEVVNRLYQTLLTNVTSGGSYTDMIESLRKTIVTEGDNTGLIKKYAGTYVQDTLATFSGQGDKVFADQMNAEWFRYIGSNIETTREFCEHLTKKEWFHKSEIPTLLDGVIDGHECKIYEATGMPYGMKDDTTPENFIVNRGGWRCRHRCIPQDTASVPKAVRADRITQRANHSGDEIGDLSNNISEKFDGYSTPVNFKSKESIIRKANSDYDGNVEKVVDAVRTTLVLPQNKIEECISTLESTGNIIRTKRQLSEDFMGYSGNILNIRLKNGLIGEIQINTDKIIYAKEKRDDAIRIMGEKRWNEIYKEVGVEGGLGHKYYEKWRSILDKNSNEAKLIKEKSIEYYTHFR